MRKVTKDDLKGEVANFPLEVLQKMCDYQEVFNPEVFQKYCSSSKYRGGFDWEETKEGYEFWGEVIRGKNFELFFKKYHKYPQVMWVWNNEIDGKEKRVVFMEKCGKFLAWDGWETLEEAESEIYTNAWNFAEPIETITKKEAEEILGKTII